MKKAALLVSLASVTAVAMAADPQVQAGSGTPVLLSRSITPGGGSDHAGDLIVLLEPRSNGCRYIGELTDAKAPSDLGNKILDIGLQDNRVWSIQISRKVCGSNEESVALDVDLGRPTRYGAGTRFFAQPAQ